MKRTTRLCVTYLTCIVRCTLHVFQGVDEVYDQALCYLYNLYCKLYVYFRVLLKRTTRLCVTYITCIVRCTLRVFQGVDEAYDQALCYLYNLYCKMYITCIPGC